MTLIEVLETLAVPYQQGGESPQVTTGWIGLICPWCGEGTGKFGLGIPLTAPYVCKCWKCGKHNLVEALGLITGKHPREIKEVLHAVHHQKIITVPNKRPGRLELPGGIENLKRVHARYLQSRGYDPRRLSKRYHLQAIGFAARLAWRLFIPIRLSGRIVSWTTRAISDDAEPRYINARPDQEEVPIKSLLYGAEHCRHVVAVVEGPTDVWRIGKGAAGTFGTNVSTAQLKRIAAYPVRVIAFDNEPTAQEQAKKLCYDLEPYPGKTVRVEIDAPDPGSMSPKEVARFRKSFLQS